ncbi:MAG: class I SAM-dependent methyltransferase [Eubacterium sp.]|nr:class I SAM-dependent methyltransferase [Eubacterium sp.]
MNRKTLKCQICGNSGEFKVFEVQDYNRAGTTYFEYSICSYCGCMQIVSVPDNLSDYYGNSYYSFCLRTRNKVTGTFVHWLMEKRDIFEIIHKGYIGRIMHGFIPRPAYGVIGNYTKKSDAILDVGCGDGYLLYLLEKLGYKNLSGCDRFITQEALNKNLNSKIKFIYGTIKECSEEYDLIMFHHSFEHIENPRETMLRAYQKLRVGGGILISIPIAGSNVFRKFGKYWVQLDAPRHIFLHSIKSMNILVDELGLSIDRILFDSSAFQYIGSIQYSKGKDGNYRRTILGIFEYAILAFSKYSKIAKRDNACGKGDQATFVLRKID